MNRIEDVTNYIKEYDDEVGKALELELEDREEISN